jgi:NAD(P)-dependent dehydrogenase (short-subunit alcohol dehydrogenase family)
MTKVFFITGGNRGIGFELVKQLSVNSNYEIIASTRNVSTSGELVKLSESNKNVKIVTLDVSDEESISKLPAQFSKLAPNGIDVFISNAAIAEDEAYHPVVEVPSSVFLKHYKTNVLGPIVILQTVLPFLKQKDTRQIILISSLVGSVSTYLPFSVSAYGQSKAALNHSAQAIAFELQPEGFTTIAVHPGGVNTEMGGPGISLIAQNHPELGSKFKAGLIEADQSARLQIELYEKIDKNDNGKFFSYDGTIAPW